MREKLPPHVLRVRNRTGRDYYYLTVHRGTAREGKRIRLPDDPRSPEFWNTYAKLMKLAPARDNPHSIRNLDAAWEQSPEWKALSEGTQRMWSRFRKRIVDAWGDLEASGIEPRHVMALRDTYAETPASTNNMLRCLSSMLAWSVPRGYRADNPCTNVPMLRGGDGYRPWPWAVICAAERELRHKGREDLWWAIALALYTGQRLDDCLGMRRNAIKDGLIYVRQKKTGKELWLPVHRDLRAVLDTIPARSTHILTSAEGTPWQGGFHTAWSKHKPSLVRRLDLVFHGLRKSAVVTLLEAGCTVPETSAITGQTMKMVEHYAAGVNQKRLAASAILKWEREQNRN